MKEKSRWIGLFILILVALAAFALDQWGRALQPRHYTIRFASSSEVASTETARIANIASQMAAKEGYKAIITGHTGPRGDAAANQMLSKQRAERIKKLLVEKGIAPERIRTFGLGGTAPLEKSSEEGERSYYQRLKRADVTLKLR